MLKKIIDGILRYKGVILFAMALLFAVTIVGTVFLSLNKNKINSDVSSYLDEDSDTKTGLVFMESQFSIRGYVTLVVRVDENKEEQKLLYEKIDNLSENKLITGITWSGSMDGIETTESKLNEAIEIIYDNSELLEKALEKYSVAENVDDMVALLEIASYAHSDVDLVDPSALRSFLRRETATEGVYDYVLLFLLATDGVGEESYALLDDIKSEFSDTSYASSGTIETGQRLLNDTLADLPWFILAGVGVVVIILLLTTSSWVEPFIMLLTLTVGIVISMGMNYLFPSISIISFAISAVLQLAITMDYAVFYTHLYRKNRGLLDAKEATLSTWPEAAASILASGLTTVGGFVALYCMQFKIGADIANVLIKGIVLSVVTVLLLQPILTYLLDKQIVSTTHAFTKKFNEKAKLKKPIEKGMIAKPVARFSVFARIGIAVVAVGLLVPCYLAQSKVPFSYLQLYEKENTTEEQVLSNELGNQLILAVPFEIKKDGKTHKDFAKEIESIGGERVSGVMSAFTVLNIDEKYVKIILNRSDTTIDTTMVEFLDLLGLEENETEQLTDVVERLAELSEGVDFSTVDSYFRKIDDKWYTLYTVSFNGNVEDEEAQSIYAGITALCDSYFGKDTSHAIGMVISGYEMAQITPGDFLRVTIVSVVIIFLIVTILLRNPLKSLLIVLVIELGIWLNLSFSYLAGESINFIVYVIISSVELGCTVDYAILFANTFERNRDECKSGKECAVLSATQSMPAIFTGALMISAVCAGMYFISSNIVIKQLVGVLARGAAISFVLVAVVITAIWSFFPVQRKKINFAEKVAEIDKKMEESTENESSSAPSKPSDGAKNSPKKPVPGVSHAPSNGSKNNNKKKKK